MYVCEILLSTLERVLSLSNLQYFTKWVIFLSSVKHFRLNTYYKITFYTSIIVKYSIVSKFILYEDPDLNSSTWLERKMNRIWLIELENVVLPPNNVRESIHMTSIYIHSQTPNKKMEYIANLNPILDSK